MGFQTSISLSIKMKQVGIYTIFSPSNKVYVGQSWNIKHRIACYSGGQCAHQSKLNASFKKYGWENHKFNTVLYLNEKVEQKILDFWEQYLMDFYRARGYELMNIREGGSRGKHTEETIKRMCIAQKGRIVSEETKKKLSAITLAQGMCGENHPMWGKKHSKESRLKMSLSHLGCKNRAKAVIQTDKYGNIKEWFSATEAASSLGIRSMSNISACCRGKIKQAYGFVWKYKEKTCA